MPTSKSLGNIGPYRAPGLTTALCSVLARQRQMGAACPSCAPLGAWLPTDAFMQSMASKSRFHASHLLPVLDSCALRRDETYVRALICSPAPPRPTVQAQLCSIRTSVQRTRVIDRFRCIDKTK